MKTCPKCAQELDDNVKFCPMCGTPVGDRKEEDKTEEKKTWDESWSGGQPVYGQQRYTQTVQTSEPQKTNGFAIAGFVLSFFFAILGIIFSAIALKQIAERNEGGHGLAVAGLVLSIVWIALWLVLFSTGACAFTSLRFLI